MKKAAVILLAAFYLLLSGGSYVCAMHCATAKVITPKVSDCCSETGTMPMACHKTSRGANNCAKTHGSFIIKENLKPSFTFNALKQVAVVSNTGINSQSANYKTIAADAIQSPIKAPPKIGRNYIIRLRTLLI